jgi:5-methylcytosine-specific restriction protein A
MTIRPTAEQVGLLAHLYRLGSRRRAERTSKRAVHLILGSVLRPPFLDADSFPDLLRRVFADEATALDVGLSPEDSRFVDEWRARDNGSLKRAMVSICGVGFDIQQGPWIVRAVEHDLGRPLQRAFQHLIESAGSDAALAAGVDGFQAEMKAIQRELKTRGDSHPSWPVLTPTDPFVGMVMASFDPTRFTFYQTGAVRRALEGIGAQWPSAGGGASYVAVCGLVREARDALQAEGIPVEDLIDTQSLLYMLGKSLEPAVESSQAPVPETEADTNAVPVGDRESIDEAGAAATDHVKAVYLNGVYRGVLEEILKVQAADPRAICYLQPYSESKILLFEELKPSPTDPVTLYISTSDALSVVSYRARVVGWEDKRKLSAERLEALNTAIRELQPGEKEIYLIARGKRCVNLLAVSGLQHLGGAMPVSSLAKASDGTPLGERTQPGGWAYVLEVSELADGSAERVSAELEDASFDEAFRKSRSMSAEERRKRLRNAPRLPQRIQLVSQGFRRNPDVAAEVLIRAQGRCERCHSEAPFSRASDGTPYLEIHHRQWLARDGEDTVDNAVAFCPNCHRELHFGKADE